MTIHYVAHGESAVKFEGPKSKQRALKYAQRVYGHSLYEPQRKLRERRPFTAVPRCCNCQTPNVYIQSAHDHDKWWCHGCWARA